MSNLSRGSSSVSRALHYGIPKRCWCGAATVAKLSRSDGNPFRRHYRCSYAFSAKLADDKHVFKWVDEACVNEIEALNERTGHLENDVKTMSSYMEDQERFVREKVEKEVAEEVRELAEEVCELVRTVEWRLKVINIVLIGVISFGVIKWIG